MAGSLLPIVGTPKVSELSKKRHEQQFVVSLSMDQLPKERFAYTLGAHLVILVKLSSHELTDFLVPWGINETVFVS